ncbi:MAG: tetratricopeptide repeat protein, partial [Thermoanaerobaculia bacterium]
IVGAFLEVMKRAGIYDRAIIVLTSDHGEGLGDHGEQEHGIFLYREAIHVPLLLKLPAAQSGGTRVAAPVQLIDILPTVASLTGMAVPDGAKGTSLIDLARRPVVRRIFSETMYPRLHLGLSDLRSLVDDRFHFIEAPRPELYRLPDDPAEKHNVISEDRRVYAEMKQGIAAFDGHLQAPSGITSEEAQKLAALGYIGSATASTAVSTRDPKDFISSVEAMKAAHSIDDLQTVVRKNPEYTDAWAELAKALERAGRFEEAASAYQRTLALVPTMTEETALSLASVYLNLNRLDEAKKHAALALRSNAGAAHLLLGRVALAQKDYAGAEQQARLAEADEHYRLQGGVLLAQTLTKTNRMPEALTLINSVQQEIEQKHLRPLLLLHFARGDALARLGRIAEAQEAFREEIRLFPHDRQTYAHLAALYLLQGRRRDADQTIDQLIANNRDRESYRLAYETYSRLGDAAAAEVWRSRLKRLESDQQR